MSAGVVIAGAGQAGFQAAASLRLSGYRERITLVGDEPELPYQRPPLSKEHLAAADRPGRIHLCPADFYDRRGITLRRSERVERLERDARVAVLASGERLPYDHAILALGARARRLRVPGGDLDGVHVLRTIADARALSAALDEAQRIVVAGGGFIGLEVAAVARGRGKEVVVVEALDRTMARVVSPEVSRSFTRRHLAAGVRILLGAGVDEIEGADGRVTAVRTGDGRRLPADLVVVGVGVTPNTEMAKASELEADDGVIVDEQLRTSDLAVSAIGDCASFPCHHSGSRLRLESVPNAVDQARCVAARIAGRPTTYTSVPWFWSVQYGHRLQIAGLTAHAELAVVDGDVDAGSFSVLCFRDDRLVGVESVDRPADHLTARRVLAARTDLRPEEAACPSFDLKRHLAAVAA